MNEFDYKRLHPFKWFVIQNFPFIEADFDAITNYQLYCKVVEYLNKTINSQNTVGAQMENLTNAFINLQNYVNNYFNNLDVQDEINNKLDEMAENGQLLELLNQERIICIGDSYGVGITYPGATIESWCDKLKNLRNLDDNNFIKLVESESGFTRPGANGHTFQSLLENSNITNPGTITKIIVCGGHNEFNSNDQTLNTAISNFITYCKTHFINAKIYVGMIGNNNELSNFRKISKKYFS